MNPELPTGLPGRLLALAVTILVAAVMWLAVAAPLLAWHAERAEQLAQRRTLLRRMAAIADTLPDLRQRASVDLGQGPAAGTLLSGASDAVAAASLQQSLQDMAAQVGATLTSAETLAPTQAGGNRRIAIRVSLAATWSVLAKLLGTIQQASPDMVIDDLQVHAGRYVTPPPDPPLETSFTVVAFRPGTA